MSGSSEALSWAGVPESFREGSGGPVRQRGPLCVVLTAEELSRAGESSCVDQLSRAEHWVVPMS